MIRNLKSGLRLALFRRVSREAFVATPTQIVLLFALEWLFTLATEWLRIDGAARFSIWGVYYHAFYVTLTLLAAYLVALALRSTQAFATFLTASLAGTIAISVFFLAIEIANDAGILSYTVYSWLWYALLAWVAIVIIRAIGVAGATRRLAQIGLGLAVLAVSLMPLFLVPQQQTIELAYTQPARPRIDVEQTFYAQPALTQRSLDQLAAQRPGVIDLYFIGFAAYSDQDVFFKETNYVRKLFDQRLDTAGRSLLLSNHPSTLRTVPLASASNLDHVLERLAKIMDPEEDVLFLFLTSHGDRNLLAVDFWPLDLNDLQANHLRDALRRAGIKWKVVVISACHSGSFIDELQDSTSMIMTAARGDRKSFGCSAESDFTYFSKALFADSLGRGATIRNAFDQAKALVERRERAEKLEPSLPQIYSTPAIEAKLGELETRLAQARAQPGAAN